MATVKTESQVLIMSDGRKLTVTIDYDSNGSVAVMHTTPLVDGVSDSGDLAEAIEKFRAAYQNWKEQL